MFFELADSLDTPGKTTLAAVVLPQGNRFATNVDGVVELPFVRQQLREIGGLTPLRAGV